MNQDAIRLITDPHGCRKKTVTSIRIQPTLHFIDCVISDLQQLGITVQTNLACRINMLDSQCVSVPPIATFFRIPEDCLTVSLLQRIIRKMFFDKLPLRSLFFIDS